MFLVLLLKHSRLRMLPCANALWTSFPVGELYVCTHTCTQTHVSSCIRIHTHIRLSTHTHTHTHTHSHTHIVFYYPRPVPMAVGFHWQGGCWECVHEHVCMCVCVCVCAYTYTHTHTHTSTHTTNVLSAVLCRGRWASIENGKVGMYVQVFVCACGYTHTQAHTYVHTHTHTHPFSTALCRRRSAIVRGRLV